MVLSTETVSAVVEELFSHGASYLCTWGSDCERVHDVADETDTFPSPLASPEDAVRLTTWHTDDPLEEVVDFFLRWTMPHAYYEPTTTGSLILCIGDDLLARATLHVLGDARQVLMPYDAKPLACGAREGGWLAICGWLLLCLAGEAMYLARWVAERDSPAAHELLLGVSLAAFWAVPAILVVIVLSWITRVEPGSALPRRAAQWLAVVVTLIWTSALIAAALS